MALSENAQQVIKGMQGLFKDLETLGVTAATRVTDKVDNTTDEYCRHCGRKL